MMNGQAGLIALAEGGTFGIRAHYGISPDALDYFAPLLTDIPQDDPEAFVIPELTGKMQRVGQQAGMELHQVIALPLVVANELVGVIYIFRTTGGSFTRTEVRMLQAFADQAAIAVQNSHLLEETAQKKQRLDA